MSVYVATEAPEDLLASISQGIRSGRIRTWIGDDEGNLSHEPDQWRGRAWFSPRAADQSVVFRFTARRGQDSTALFAVYHGRLVEMLLTHFAGYLEEIRPSTKPDGHDRIR